MRRSEALSDEDRLPWLQTLAALLAPALLAVALADPPPCDSTVPMTVVCPLRPPVAPPSCDALPVDTPDWAARCGAATDIRKFTGPFTTVTVAGTNTLAGPTNVEAPCWCYAACEFTIAGCIRVDACRPDTARSGVVYVPVEPCAPRQRGGPKPP